MNTLTHQAFCLCRAAVEGEAQWFHRLPPVGEYPGGTVTHKGRKIKGATFVIDQASVDGIVAAFRKEAQDESWAGMLVDREHSSLGDATPTDAMAWARDIRADESGVWTRWGFTPPGRELWDSKVLVNRSPVLALEPLDGNRFHVEGLKSIGMTNKPFFGGLSTLAAARAADDQNQRSTHMEKILLALGLGADATEDEAVAAITKLLADLKAADAGASAQAACRAAECESFIAANYAGIGDEAGFRKAYEANPVAAKTAFAACRAAAPQTRIDASKAKTPETDAAAGAQRRNKQGAAIAACRAANPGMSCAEAEAACRRNDPELFAYGKE